MSDDENENDNKDENKSSDGADSDDALEEQAAGESDGGDGADWGDAMEEQSTAEAAAFDQVSDTSVLSSNSELNLDVILDVPVNVSMEVGHTKISIRNLLQLNQGSVIELDRLAGEPMDVLVNGTLIARGEVVVVNDKFGLRLTDIISPAERVKKLK
ncbi:MAG: flagellar motor switch protein FliN [Piscirickettsiaceae bacterium]|nr:MAG: flagellar motor switch protein FliN [Piscirickettsiaceae bacterium]